MPKYLVLLVEPVTDDKRHIINHVKDSTYMGRRRERTKYGRTGELYEVTYISRAQLKADLILELLTSEFVVSEEYANPEAFIKIPELFGDTAA